MRCSLFCLCATITLCDWSYRKHSEGGTVITLFIYLFILKFKKDAVKSSIDNDDVKEALAMLLVETSFCVANNILKEYDMHYTSQRCVNIAWNALVLTS